MCRSRSWRKCSLGDLDLEDSNASRQVSHDLDQYVLDDVLAVLSRLQRAPGIELRQAHGRQRRHVNAHARTRAAGEANGRCRTSMRMVSRT